MYYRNSNNEFVSPRYDKGGKDRDCYRNIKRDYRLYIKDKERKEIVTETAYDKKISYIREDLFIQIPGQSINQSIKFIHCKQHKKKYNKYSKII